MFFATAEDGADSVRVLISILNFNREPQWVEVPDTVQVEETQEIDFTVSGSDPDGDRLILGIESDDLPRGWRFTDNRDGTGFFNWTPREGDAGEYAVLFTLSDGDTNAVAEVYIKVIDQTGVVNPSLLLPADYYLNAAYPNPFNRRTTLRFGLPRQDGMNIAIYDIQERLITTLYSGRREAGNYAVNWDALNYAAGIYFVRLETGSGFKAVKKMILTP
ncbi:MAG: T9SS type A sorting domain-containing protein [Calditrichota bacterium]